MATFISDELQKIYTKLLKMIVHRSIIDEVAGPRSLLEIEFTKDTLLEPQSGKFPTSTLSVLNAAKPDALQRKNLMKDFGKIIQEILTKLRKTSLLKYGLVRTTSCLSPYNMVNKKNTSVSKFNKVVATMYDTKQLTADEADKAKDQFESFLNTEARQFQEDFLGFNMVEDRLDKFLGKWLHRNADYAALWKVMIFVFTLSHGQAQVERGFNINSDILVENLSTRSIVAQRMVYDHVNASNTSQSHDFEINHDLRISCMSAHSKYKEYLKNNKSMAEKTSEDEKLDNLLSEIEDMKRKKNSLNITIGLLQKDVDNCYDNAEKYSDNPQKMQAEVSKGNSLRKTIGQKRKIESQYEDNIAQLRKEVDGLKKKKRK